MLRLHLLRTIKRSLEVFNEVWIFVTDTSSAQLCWTPQRGCSVLLHLF